MTNEPDTIYLNAEKGRELINTNLNQSTFIEKVDSFHIENNTSLESCHAKTQSTITRPSSENSE